ncbi:MAG TPA: TrkA C-terminal domain-containing protein [Candidatus Eremiobacteraeota bacterium]|nr:MAG: Aspartate/alanine antiporter [bacterium ADurb.Bin363]HPZ09311.1 TrkA C-terminal domain-containing protein [Candidatus Eremiobacteraeota bacterium]
MFLKHILSEPVFITFSVLFLGLALGRVKIKGFSLGNSGIFFTGLICGIADLKTSDFITIFGLAIFMYVIGIQGGVRFFNLLGRKGIPYLLITLVLCISGLAGSLLTGYIFNFPTEISLGIFTGTLTSASSLAILIESGWKGPMLAAYSIVFPLGLLAPLLFVQIIPSILKKDLHKEALEEKNKIKEEHPSLISRKFMVENPEIAGKKIKELDIRGKTGCTLEKLKRKGKLLVPGPETTFKKGDVVLAVGEAKSLEMVHRLLGNITYDDMDINPLVENRQILITNPSLHEVPLMQLGITQNYHAVITRIWRGGIEFAPTKNFILDIGDSLIVSGKKNNLDRLVAFLGKEEKKIGEVDFLSMAFGIAIGMIIGSIHIPLGRMGTFMLGTSGGTLLVGMILAYFRRLGFLTGQMTTAARNVLKELGLSLFLAGIGEKAGTELIAMNFSTVILILLSSIFIILLIMTSMLYVSQRYLRMNLITSLSCIAGAITSTPALSIISGITESEEPDLVFASIYPVALIGIILTSQILAIICKSI